MPTKNLTLLKGLLKIKVGKYGKNNFNNLYLQLLIKHSQYTIKHYK